MTKFLGISICWILRKPRWGKPFIAMVDTPVGSMNHGKHKRCIRCGELREVKPRKRKDG